jgi:hypothetical protein
MTETTIADPFTHAYADYHGKGWAGTLPLPYARKKSPPTGYTGHAGVYPSYPDLLTWADDGPQNICQRMRADVVGIDVDAYAGKPGAQTLATLVTAFGALPATFMSTSRDDGISGIRYYRIPAGATLRDSLPGIELIQRHHRYAVVWPSIHPDTGQAYRWVDEASGEVDCPVPAVDDLPALPAAWLTGLRTEAKATSKAGLDRDGLKAVAEGFPVGTPCEHVLKAAGKALEGTSRHDAYNAAVLAVARYARRGCPGGGAVLGRLHRAFVAEISAPGERATAGEAEAEWVRCVDGALAIVADEPQGSGCVDEVVADWLGTLHVATVDTPDGQITERTSWWPRDLAGVMSGEDPEPQPSYLARLDGVALFYPGKVNGLIGESESGKTWVALLAVQQALQQGQRVLYLDFEDTAPGIVARLRSMGVTDADIAGLRYVGPDEDLGADARRDLAEAVTDHEPHLIILDGFNAAMTLLGLELIDNTDATTFAQRLLKPLARTGACVVYVDHVAKNRDNRAKGGIGAQAKRAMTTGCAISVEVVAAFGRGMTGRLRLTVDKDRPGHVRAASLGATRIGDAVLTSGDDGAVTVEVERPYAEEEVEQMHDMNVRRQIMSFVKRQGDDGCSKADIEDALPGKVTLTREHVKWLIAHGQLVDHPTRRRNGHPVFIVNPDHDQLRWDL